MNDFSARRGSASAGAERAIDRRQLLRAGAWAAPVIVLATAAPAAAASGDPAPTTGGTPGTVASSKLTVSSYGLGNRNLNGAQRGPLGWDGGQIQYSNATWQDQAGTIGYRVLVSGPAGYSHTIIAATSAAIAPYGSVRLEGVEFGAAPMASGTYTVTVTVFASDNTLTAATSVTIP